jgi:hypothetical protein
MEDYNHTLTEKIQVSSNGGKQDVHIVTLVCPVKKFIRKTYQLQQWVKQAQVHQLELIASAVKIRDGLNIKPEPKKEDDDKPDDKPDVMSADEMMNMLLSSKVDIEKVSDEFERLALLGAVQIDGENIKQKNWDDLAFEDQEGLMLEYMAFFISILAER